MNPIPRGDPARVLVVDDQPLFREGMCQLIGRQPDLDCCGQAGTAAAAVRSVEEVEPDLLILDLRLGTTDGLDLIKSLRVRFPNLAILVVSQFDERVYAERALRAGANGFIMKEEAGDEVLNAVRTVLSGECYLSRRMSAVVLGRLADQGPRRSAAGVESLTDRELQVFRLLGSGLSTRSVAEALHLSVKTVEAHRETLKHKLNLHNAVQLIAAASRWVNGGDGPVAREARDGDGDALASI